jgi:L-alanine-DL-glutamate epimerase-like enolase superfamily enzyme
VWAPQDVLKVVESEAADIVNIKITKSAGLKHAFDVYNIARTAGIPCVIGTELESCVGIASKLQMSAAMEDLPYASEFTELSFQKIAVKESLEIKNGHLAIPEGPGLGLTPDIGLIQQHRVSLQSPP